MKKFKFKKLDAFATQKSDGNPAGYIWLNSKEDILPSEMQQIAKELKGFVNEVGFVHQTDHTQFNLKYYSSEREVDFCGHATIAIMYDLIKNDRDLIQHDLISIKTNKGILSVENRLHQDDAVYIMSPPPQIKEDIPTIHDISSALKITRGDIEKNLPVSIINAGLTTLIVPIQSLDSIIHIKPEIDALKEFCINSDIDIIEVFTKDVSNKINDYRTRVFAAVFGYLEDPATGSGNSALGYYLIQNRIWKKKTICIEQNDSLDKYNIIKIKKQKDNTGKDRVLFGGGAITKIEGEYTLY